MIALLSKAKWKMRFFVLFWLTTTSVGDVVRGSNDESHSTKLRHSRHLKTAHGPSADGSYSDEYLMNQHSSNVVSSSLSYAQPSYQGNNALIVRDNHKPIFKDCNNYRPTVKEEQPTGTFVIQVNAVDEDPPEHGGKITYSFVSGGTERLKFAIHPQNGNITTKTMLDWDEPVREKELYVTVRATDNGKPQLDDTCTFKITVEDINDNRPMFDKVIYEESIPQDLKVDGEVMRIFANDIDDGNNSLVMYDLSEDKGYFHVDRKTGIVKLTKPIDKPPGYVFRIKATASDQGVEEPKSSDANLVITVVESDKKAPFFSLTPDQVIHVPEDFNDYSANIASYTAVSNTDEKEPVYHLVDGRTEQTNGQHTFHLISEQNHAYIRLSKPLDYEKLDEYDLTVRIQNKYKLATEHVLKIIVEDVNDNIPQFAKDVYVGKVLENEPPGTPVMQVGAVDFDRTPAFNKITFELEDNTNNFRIDPDTGNITTLKKLDREEKDSYNVKVIAKDGAPSSLTKNNEPNKASQVFSIEIADKNDHPPHFTKSIYDATDIPEDASLNSLVTEVKAVDRDSASTIEYSITEGNTYDAFFIEPETGKIKVKNRLDYENITHYLLQVTASDGLYQDKCEVNISIQNVNDNLPVFLNFENRLTIREEELIPDCLTTVKAYDPDIADRNADQKIVFNIVKENQRKYFTIDKSGCLKLIKPLDRDQPLGYETWQVLISANDEDAASGSAPTKDVIIDLIDINDNAPYIPKGEDVVIWQENQNYGKITMLKAADNDGPSNGPPFNYAMASETSADIHSKFEIIGTELHSKVSFDREEQKEYIIPISITDSGNPPQTGISYMKVIIGDENDNAMKAGSSSIFVYYYENATHDTEIGRVYVEDPDDWDLPDKRFEWQGYENELLHIFSLNRDTGMITMSHGTFSESYMLQFKVTENPKSGLFPKHSVTATVNVTIKEIPEEAVDKSGSIRFEAVSPEQFITKDENGVSKADALRTQLAIALNNSEENIDVFTVMRSPFHLNETHLDVRFSAHGSPYYSPERINSAIIKLLNEFEKAVGLTILMVNVDECLYERVNCESSCSNELKKNKVSAAVFTNSTSFIGISAYIEPICECRPAKQVCLNGALPTSNGGCNCPEGFEGPQCQQTSIGFSGNGWALYPSFDACSEVHLTLYVHAMEKDCLIFYIGPDSIRSNFGVDDFMSLELRRGYPVLLVNYGTGVAKIEHSYKPIVGDGAMHKIEIILGVNSIEMIVDNCKLQKCMGLTTPAGPNRFLNVNGPLQIGGTYMDLVQIGLSRSWTSDRPFSNGFNGCIKNFTFNDKMLNLGMPSASLNADPGCSRSIAASITFGFDWTFLAAIFICLMILTILLMAVAVHRRKVEDMYKDTDDIRENIINYEDEGGGEGDMTGYDLNVLRLQDYDPISEDKYINRMLPTTGMDEVPDICGFLDGKKHAVDNDPETLPFDDVRHYAYEGDGNTTGSLSSLASGTDEGDLNFDYLSNFGPRFRKLADMYGEDASDEDSDTYHNTASVSWC